MKEELRLTPKEMEVYNLLRDLGYITAAKKGCKTEFSVFVKAILMFKKDKGLFPTPCLDDAFLSMLQLAYEVENSGNYGRVYSLVGGRNSEN